MLAIDPENEPVTNPVILIEASLKRSGRAMRLVQDGMAGSGESEPQEHLLKLLHRAREWWRMMVEKNLTISALARKQRVTSSYASRVVRLNFLAPRIVETIVIGKHPLDLDAKKLLGLNDLPLCWDAQIERLLEA